MKSYDELKALIERRGVHTVFGEPGEGWFIEQNPHELAQFLVHMQALGVTSVLEIGTGWRAGLARFLHDDMGWSVTSVDVKDYGHRHDGVQFIAFHSYDGEELEHIPQQDLLIIDGDHSYEGVKRDHVFWANRAAKVIAFHDIAGLRDCEGVREYWREISEWNAGINDIPEPMLKPGYYEMISDTPERGGIGYVVLAEVSTVPDITAQGTGLDGEPITLKVEAVVDVPPSKPRTRKPAAKKPTTTTKKAPVKK